MNDVVLFRLQHLGLARVVTVLLYRVKCNTGRAQIHVMTKSQLLLYDISLLSFNFFCTYIVS